MPADTAPAWPDPARPGVPTLPEVDAFHWLLKRNGAWPEAWLWQSDADGCGTEYSGAWAESDGDGQPDTMARWYSYLGPCLTPAEVAAREAAAWQDAMDLAKARVRVWWSVNGERIAADLATLQKPAAAQAALDAVVREAVERHGLEALITDDYLEVEAAIAAAIRARGDK